MVEVEVGEHDVGDVRRRHAVGGQAVEEPAAVEQALDTPDPGVDQDDVVAAPDEESAQGELDPAVVGEELPVLRPLLVGRPGERLGGREHGQPVDHRHDVDGADAHRLAHRPSIACQRPGARSTNGKATIWAPSRSQKSWG